MLLVLVITGIYSRVYCQQADSLTKITERLYMITGRGGNISFLVTDAGVLVVDAGNNNDDGKTIEHYVRSITDKPIKYLVLTDPRDDHSFSTCTIDKNRKTMNQEELDALRKRELDSLMHVNSQEWLLTEQRHLADDTSKICVISPQDSLKDELIIYLDKDTIKLIRIDSTHTDCNMLVEFVNQKVLSTGDFFDNKCMPYINVRSNTTNWMRQLNRYSRNGYAFVIPGHGGLADPKDLAIQAKYIYELRKEIEINIKNDKTLSQMLHEIKMADYSDYKFQFMLWSEIEAIYHEMTTKKK